jgi:hypothetical protein
VGLLLNHGERQTKTGGVMKIYIILIAGRLFQTFNKNGVAITTIEKDRALLFYSHDEAQDVVKLTGGEAVWSVELAQC